VAAVVVENREAVAEEAGVVAVGVAAGIIDQSSDMFLIARKICKRREAICDE
jgi:hypothetical protein